MRSNLGEFLAGLLLQELERLWRQLKVGEDRRPGKVPIVVFLPVSESITDEVRHRQERHCVRQGVDVFVPLRRPLARRKQIVSAMMIADAEADGIGQLPTPADEIPHERMVRADALIFHDRDRPIDGRLGRSHDLLIFRILLDQERNAAIMEQAQQIGLSGGHHAEIPGERRHHDGDILGRVKKPIQGGELFRLHRGPKRHRRHKIHHIIEPQQKHRLRDGLQFSPEAEEGRVDGLDHRPRDADVPFDQTGDLAKIWLCLGALTVDARQSRGHRRQDDSVQQLLGRLLDRHIRRHKFSINSEGENWPGINFASFFRRRLNLVILSSAATAVDLTNAVLSTGRGGVDSPMKNNSCRINEISDLPGPVLGKGGKASNGS